MKILLVQDLSVKLELVLAFSKEHPTPSNCIAMGSELKNALQTSDTCCEGIHLIHVPPKWPFDYCLYNALR